MWNDAKIERQQTIKGERYVAVVCVSYLCTNYEIEFYPWGNVRSITWCWKKMLNFYADKFGGGYWLNGEVRRQLVALGWLVWQRNCVTYLVVIIERSLGQSTYGSVHAANAPRSIRKKRQAAQHRLWASQIVSFIIGKMCFLRFNSAQK